jgi:hypothetical protein
MVRGDFKRSEFRVPLNLHEQFVAKCSACRLDMNAALLTLVECVVNGSIVLESPRAVAGLARGPGGVVLGEHEVPPHARSKREALRRIGEREGRKRAGKKPGRAR